MTQRVQRYYNLLVNILHRNRNEKNKSKQVDPRVLALEELYAYFFVEIFAAIDFQYWFLECRMIREIDFAELRHDKTECER